jgi:hypothetical protein
MNPDKKVNIIMFFVNLSKNIMVKQQHHKYIHIHTYISSENIFSFNF